MTSNIHFYSERGLVDALVLDFNDCMNNGKKDIVQNFFQSIKIYDDKSDNKPKINPFQDLTIDDHCQIDWFIELDIGTRYGFGSPDLIAKVVSNEKKYLFFFEAKLTSFDENANQPICNSKNIYHKQGSLINIQLFYKYLFSKALKSNGLTTNSKNGKKEIAITLKHNSKNRSYRLQKDDLLKLYDENMYNDINICDIYYIALTNEGADSQEQWHPDNKYFAYLEEAGVSCVTPNITLKKNEFLEHLGCLNYSQFIKDNLVNLTRLNAYKSSDYHYNSEWPDCLNPDTKTDK